MKGDVFVSILVGMLILTLDTKPCAVTVEILANLNSLQTKSQDICKDWQPNKLTMILKNINYFLLVFCILYSNFTPDYSAVKGEKNQNSIINPT